MSEALTSFHFIRPTLLLLVPVTIAVWWVWQKRSDPLRGWREQMDQELLKALAPERGSHRPGPARWCLAAWLIAAIAAAGPTWRPEPSPFAGDAAPLMILLKAGVTMDTPDPAPSRLERAHLKIADLADARKGQPLGLIAYSGSAHLVLPPTRDTAIVAQMAREITPDIMPEPGDRLDLAIAEAVRVLNEGGNGGSILVIADVVDTQPELVSATANNRSYPIQFLQIRSPDSPLDDSLSNAAKLLRATVETLAIDDQDIEAIARRASRTPTAQSGELGDRWQESGYWLLPPLGLILAASFRREQRAADAKEVHE